MSHVQSMDKTLRRYDREFHQYSVANDANILPVDEAESERQREWHDILKAVLQDRLRETFRSRVFSDRRIVYAPVRKLRSVLDCGYGAGAWAEDLAEDLRELHEDVSDDNGREEMQGGQEGAQEESPNWKICGIDVVRVPTEVRGSGSSGGSNRSSDASSQGDPVFAQRLLWDLNRSLTENPELFTRFQNRASYANEPFDLVNIRCLTEGIKSDRWKVLLRELFTLLRPDGYIQITELAFGNIQSDSGRMADAVGLQGWIDCYREGMKRLERTEPHVGKVLGDNLNWAEFEDIESQCIQLDIGNWRSTGDATLSSQILDVMEATLSSLGVWLACEVLQKPLEEFQEMVQRATADLRNPDFKLYLWCYVFVARKPDPRKRKAVDDANPSSSSKVSKLPPIPTPFPH
ncbi:hypothetical protein K461DRAFT_294913 [Myriangium duriaei CBS 260.36]|uniref:Methyltransferase domain-containing protein n=1 Tax=Myriangium duriaei CBS 260.36 TaxID=1168546 RepID=A0A9P4J446_9PEZI|nr:hypothetical protein K461DRAFT_294913 [Myriangium duriaei CBS 260.36]